MFNVGSVQGYLKLNTTGWTGNMKSAQMSIGSLTKSFIKLGVVATGSLLLIEREFGRFDKAIRHATSVSDTTTDQFDQMSEMALDASVRWNKAATETAQAFYFLGSAGLTVTEQMQTFNDTIMLSRAMGSELSMTVEGMVDIVRAFNLEFSNSRVIADQLAKTVITSNQNFGDLDKAMSYVSSTARFTNNTLAETTAMLGIMANAGIKGSMAGTILRRAFANLMSPTAAMRDLIYELGVRIYDTNGKMLPYIDILGQINDKLAESSDEHKNLVFRVLFGVRAIGGQIALFNEGSVAIKKYTDAIKNAGGTSERVAMKQMKAFTEQLGRLWQEIKRVAIAAGSTLAPAIERVGTAIRERLGSFRDYINLNKEAVGQALKWTAALGALLVVGGPLLLLIASLATKMVALAAVIANPFMILIAALYTLRAVWKQTSDEMKNRAAEVAVNINESMNTKFVSFLKNLLPEDLQEGFLQRLYGSSSRGERSFGASGDFGLPPEKKVIDYGAIWAETLSAVKKQMVVDFGAGVEFMDDTLSNMDGTLGNVVGSLKEYLATVQEMYNVFMTEPVKKAAEETEKAITDGVTNMQIKTKETTKTFATYWKNAVRGVVNDTKSWHSLFTNTASNIRSEWANTIEFFMKEGTTLKDFLEQMFLNILHSFNRMVAEMAANRLFYSTFGSILDPKYKPDAGLAIPGVETQGATLDSAGKLVPVTINLTNNGVPADLRVTSQKIVGKQLVIKAVMEELSTNPSFRDNIRG